MGDARRVKIALFGSNSTGKTLQIKTLIESLGVENVGIISVEDGLSTIASILNLEHVYQPTRISQFEADLTTCSQKYSGAHQFLCIDGGTRLLQLNAGKIWDATDEAYEKMVFLNMRRQDFQGKDEYKMARYGSRFITGAGEIDGYAQWKEIGVQADILFNKILQTRCNIYMNFWEDESQLGDRKKGLPWQADAPGKASRDAIYGFFDFIFRLTYDGGAPTAHHDRGKVMARTKSRDDWGGGFRVEEEMAPFKLSEFYERLRPKSNVVKMPTSQPKESA